jgi:hypothetical protein
LGRQNKDKHFNEDVAGQNTTRPFFILISFDTQILSFLILMKMGAAMLTKEVSLQISLPSVTLLLVAHAPRNLSRKIPALSTLQHEAKSYLHANKVSLVPLGLNFLSTSERRTEVI